jgi:hypothetical protein
VALQDLERVHAGSPFMLIPRELDFNFLFFLFV